MSQPKWDGDGRDGAGPRQEQTTGEGRRRREPTAVRESRVSMVVACSAREHIKSLAPTTREGGVPVGPGGDGQDSGDPAMWVMGEGTPASVPSSWERQQGDRPNIPAGRILPTPISGAARFGGRSPTAKQVWRDAVRIFVGRPKQLRLAAALVRCSSRGWCDGHGVETRLMQRANPSAVLENGRATHARESALHATDSRQECTAAAAGSTSYMYE